MYQRPCSRINVKENESMKTHDWRIVSCYKSELKPHLVTISKCRDCEAYMNETKDVDGVTYMYYIGNHVDHTNCDVLIAQQMLRRMTI
jgi:hypothetical protein